MNAQLLSAAREITEWLQTEEAQRREASSAALERLDSYHRQLDQWRQRLAAEESDLLRRERELDERLSASGGPPAAAISSASVTEVLAPEAIARAALASEAPAAVAAPVSAQVDSPQPAAVVDYATPLESPAEGAASVVSQFEQLRQRRRTG
ncbi:hypothetical protein Mal64_18750 [Pseudobythopirellula maris]|uniref:Chromosome partition protein Smc n=1 Tax=Pseudobythopirellula maris TaxID=2527991 RepID=A0A5C5ZMV1_9BACT|nr:hypothetical protein [Pseudobythopirellula maris]TWT88395.1 hypothetical protein Mal64_18750 [Pseudobythopirellula maris]